MDHQEMPLKEKGYLAEGKKYRVHIKCMEEPTKKAICAKKLKGVTNFLIHCGFLYFIEI